MLKSVRLCEGYSDYSAQNSKTKASKKRESWCTMSALSDIVRRFRGVSKKKGKWEAKVMVNRKWAYRELFDSEEEAARAYDDAVWRLKPKEAKSYINFKERFTGERAPGGRLHRPRQLSSLR